MDVTILGSIDKRVSVTAKQTEPAKINIGSNMGFIALILQRVVRKARATILRGSKTLYPIYATVHGVLKDHFEVDGRYHGVEIDIKSDIPWGAGLGSSASCVASVGAVKSLFLKPEKGGYIQEHLGLKGLFMKTLQARTAIFRLLEDSFIISRTHVTKNKFKDRTVVSGFDYRYQTFH